MIRLIVAATLVAAAGPVWVGRFTADGTAPAPWRVVRVGKAAPTSYRVATVASVRAVEARADAAMALLARPLSVDLAATPILCWRWYVDAPVASADMRSRAGDDYAARVYVSFDIPDNAMSLGTRLRIAVGRRMFGAAVPDAALNYVWDNRQAVGSRRRSAYTDRVEMIVAETGATRARQWVSERADVGADFARAFGNRGRVIQLAVASDTDNTRSRARAAFADLHFVARSERCAA
ncbi:MAG TPA: DUF3047 domain-containing protein [Allosphingosinicella sp.]|jgi:hypothetical protein